MASIESRIEEETAAIAELESRVAEQIATLRQTPSIAGEALLSALQRSLELGRKHLEFEREKLTDKIIAIDQHSSISNQGINRSHSPGDFASSFQFQVNQKIINTQHRISKQNSNIEMLDRQNKKMDLMEEHRKLLALQKILELYRDILHLERELVGGVEQHQSDTLSAEQFVPTDWYEDERSLEIAHVEFTNEEHTEEIETTELERIVLQFAQEEQKKGLSPAGILRNVKQQFHPLDLYNADIEQAGYSFGLRLPRGRYLLYRDRMSEWSIGQRKPEWL